jgi:hypothetical protein
MATGETTVNVPGRWDAFELAPGFVGDRFTDGWAAATGAYATAMQAVQNLEHIASELHLINRVISIDTTTISSGEISVDPPTINAALLTVNNPDMPVDPQLISATLDAFPEFPDLVVGDIPAPNETYTSALLTALKAKFLADVQSGGTGISAAVENAIFNRESERALLVHNDAMDEIAATVARGGYPIPSGALLAAQNKELTEYRNKRLDVSRDISIKSFELAFQHTQFVMQAGVAFEANLMGWAHSVAVLASDVAKTVVLMQIEAFKARSDGISKKIIGIIEKAKAKIEYNRGLIEIFASKVNAYGAKIKGESDRVNAVARGYEAEVGLFKSVADFEIGKAGIDLKVLDARMTQALGNANILMKDKEIELKSYEMLNSLKTDIMKAIGMIASQIGAGAMAGISASAHVSAGASASYNVTGRWTWTAADGWVLS